jgi:hypothetical protein
LIVNRKTFVGAALGAAASACMPHRARAIDSGAAFSDWILHYQVAPSGLCRYFRFGANEREESPLATAYAILWLIGSHPNEAQKLGQALIELQNASLGNRYTRGGVPSIANDPQQLFYSSDALICIKAMMALWRATRDERFLGAAGRFADFVESMTDVRGFLTSNVGYPMQYVSPNGDYQNFLVPNVGMLFFSALHDYGQAANNGRSLQLFDVGRSFLLSEAQAPNGAFYDHYDPGYPPVPYTRSRWRWFSSDKNGNVGISDNMLMSALGAQQLGDGSQVRRYLDWARPSNGAFYAYVNVENGQPAFISTDKPYFDVVCSGMYSVLRARAQRGVDPATVAVLNSAVTNDGGYRWGKLASGDGWVDSGAEALVTGYWAVLCLSLA